MEQDFITNILPSEIMINILSRLPLRTIAISKSVYKSWLVLLKTNEFIKSHLSISAPGLAVFTHSPSSYEVYEFHDDNDGDDEYDLEHERHYNLVTIFKLPFEGLIQGSANGFLLLRDFTIRHNCFFICNPITREYMERQIPRELHYTYPQVVTFGFGVSKVTGQHKVVRVFHDCVRDLDTYELLRIPKSECQVYTIGTGSWRSTTPGAPLEYNCRSHGTFLNGNLHWLVHDLNGKAWISCFDLETELFSIISPPPLSNQQIGPCGVFALKGCLCICCNNSSKNEIVMWLMKEYGVEGSWTKEYVIINYVDGESYDVARPIKVFKDGDILMAWGDFTLFYSPSKSRDIKSISIFEEGSFDSILHISSFLSLKSFGVENVVSF